MADSILPSILSVWNKLQENFCSAAASSSRPCDVPNLKQSNDMVYEVYTPVGDKPELEVVFFHGLQLRACKDAHVSTWMARDSSQLWVQTWMVELFPKARILTISYDSRPEKIQEFGTVDMYCNAENLVSSLTADEVRVGQAGCPVVLVGHCLGGLVLKELCLSAAWMMGRNSAQRPGLERIRNLLSNIRGMFFYGTPHVGSLLGDELHNCLKGALVEEMETLKVSSARRNQDFEDLRSKYRWITCGMGESCKTFVEYLGTDIHVVTEASSRQSMDTYYTANADHHDICKAEGKTSSALQRLENFLRPIQANGVHQGEILADVERDREYFIDSNGRAKEVCSMLARTDAHTIFIVGLSGIGKTILARQVFHAIRHNFDDTCFVSLDSIEGQSNGSGQVWTKIQQELPERHDGSNHNLSKMLYELKRKKVLMILDNVKSQSQLDALHTAAWLEGTSSKLIVTSTTSRLGTQSNTFEVGYLSLEESRLMFRHHAFQGGEGPRDLRDIIEQVIDKCCNYPLCIKILAGFVSKESEIHVKQLWLDLLDGLQKAEEVDGSPDYRLWGKLKVCYNVLLPSAQEVFLYTAMIFHGFRLSMVKRIWKSSRQQPHVAWSNLKSRFLVSVDCERIQMHEQLRNLGRRIACPESVAAERWKRISGYSLTKELREKLLSKPEGIVEALALQLEVVENDTFKLKNSSFHKFDHLQYLILKGGRTSWCTVLGSMKLPQSLVYLRWKDGAFTVCPVDFSGL